MVGNFKSKRQEGFTIIEVLIVLAIAGLIMLIVFLAVPALQRNSRDSQRKSDVSRILGAAQEVMNNNNGLSTSLTNANVLAAAGTLAYYPSTAAALVIAGAPAVATNSDTVDTMHLYTGSTCNGSQQAIAGTTRQLALTYKIESGNGTIQCTNS